jgi:hypothetical protein
VAAAQARKWKEEMAMNDKTYGMRNLLLVPIACLLATSLYGQGRDRDLGNINEVVTGDFNPLIKDASKISNNPVVSDTTPKIQVSAYRLKDQRVNTTFEVEPIPSARMKPEPLSRLYSTHVKAGFGNYNMPLGEVYFNSLRSKEYHYGASLRHLSSTATLPDVAYSGFSNNDASLYGKYFWDNYTLSGDFDYSRSVVHFYGYNPIEFPFVNRGDIRQRFNFFNPKVEFASTYKDTARLHHATGLSYYNLSDLADNLSENNITAKSSIRKTLAREMLNINTTVGYWHLNNPARRDTSFNLIVGLNPHIVSQRKNYHVKVGFNVAIDAATNETGSGAIFPDVDASFYLVKDIIIPYAGITGAILERNSYRALTDNNPFMFADSPFLNTLTKQKYFGGIKGNLSSTMTFNTYFSYSLMQNMPFFRNLILPVANRFEVLYDNARVTNVRGELAYQKTEKLKMLLRGDYFGYELATLPHPWHRPNWEATFTTFYTLRDKIIVRGDIFYVGERMALDSEFITVNDATILNTNAITLRPFLDVNLGLEYRYTKNLSAFINFNNIGAVRYNRWYNYPVQRFNLMGGFTFSF